ncbi:hypothetical protein SELMODRAFT_426785 [Selaginella moellendorffii]|uniref:TF-B3 domain-containing protein n=1 Tax=Selaginella moellendorffii TaxID=88036 RepID=D8SXH3_SELML|nr:B3 domain-containing protein Os11g0197600 [Selaginella moellendorffii]EFJ10887.1 hypothetical protein SELMODRAFT_426785 [Selaginella moellendorffii]|eukprot:XP_002988095.1 B3 domain-containing protein Os11g0197600 [Selaginella moellendorffii]
MSFAKTVTSSDMAAMAIPGPVYEKHRNEAFRGTVALAHGGRDWQVDASSGSFTTGWKEFWLGNALNEGDCLVFRHQSAGRFALEIFGSDGSPKEGGVGAPANKSVSSSSALKRSRDDLPAAMEVVVKDCLVHLEDGSSLKFVVTKIPPEDPAGEPFTPLVSAAKASDALPRSSRMTRSSAPVAKAPSPDAKDDSPAPKKAKIDSPKRTRKTPPPSRKQEEVSKMDSSSEKNKEPTAKSSGKKKKKNQDVPCDSPALLRAEAFKATIPSTNPSTAIVMKKSCLHPCYYLTIPKDFAEKLPHENKMLTVESNAVKEPWDVKWLAANRAFSGGWNKVAQFHNLELDDACVLEVLNKSGVRISVFKADGSSSVAANQSAPAIANGEIGEVAEAGFATVDEGDAIAAMEKLCGDGGVKAKDGGGENGDGGDNENAGQVI